MLVHRAPQQVRFATQGDEHLVEVPCATQLASRCFHPVSKALAKLVASASDCLVCHGHTALEEQFLDVAQAQLEAEVPAHGATDDAGWKTVPVIDATGGLRKWARRSKNGIRRLVFSKGASKMDAPDTALRGQNTTVAGRLYMALNWARRAGSSHWAMASARRAGVRSPQVIPRRSSPPSRTPRRVATSAPTHPSTAVMRPAATASGYTAG